MISSDSALQIISDAIANQSRPPVQDWQPAHTRDSDIRIARNGDWYYRESRIDRLRMVKLFSSVLRVDDGQMYLVTPQERLSIDVEDAPFTAVLLEQHTAQNNCALVFTTNIGDRVIADKDHPITVRYAEPGGEPTPYVLVRDQLQALISRPVYYQLADLMHERDGVLGVESCGEFMPLSESYD